MPPTSSDRVVVDVVVNVVHVTVDPLDVVAPGGGVEDAGFGAGVPSSLLVAVLLPLRSRRGLASFRVAVAEVAVTELPSPPYFWESSESMPSRSFAGSMVVGAEDAVAVLITSKSRRRLLELPGH